MRSHPAETELAEIFVLVPVQAMSISRSIECESIHTRSGRIPVSKMFYFEWVRNLTCAMMNANAINHT